jgi:hypothetical protein
MPARATIFRVAAACLLLAFAAWGLHRSGFSLRWIAPLLASAGAFLYCAWRSWLGSRRLLALLVRGRRSVVEGRADGTANLRSPLHDEACLAWVVEVDRRRPLRGWVLETRLTGQEPFEVHHGRRAVRLRPDERTRIDLGSRSLDRTSLSKTERAVFERAARRAGVPLSVFLRIAAMHAAKRGVKIGVQR